MTGCAITLELGIGFPAAWHKVARGHFNVGALEVAALNAPHGRSRSHPFQANPRETASARLTATSVSCSSWPVVWPTLLHGSQPCCPQRVAMLFHAL